MSGESIYNLLPKPRREVVKPPLFKGSHYGSNRRQGGLVGSFGPPLNQSRPHPKQFLRSGAKEASSRAAPSQASSPPARRRAAPKKAAVPSRAERPAHGLRTKKNYVTSNALEAILMAPPAAKAPQPRFMTRADFGTVPAYLADVKAEVRAETELIDQFVREQAGTPVAKREEDALEEFSEREVAELRSKLQERWNEVNDSHQRIAHRTNLEHKQLRKKELLEEELDTLERDMRRLSRTGPMYISG